MVASGVAGDSLQAIPALAIELPLAFYFALLTRRVLVTAIRVSRPEYAGTALHSVPLATDHPQEPVRQ